MINAGRPVILFNPSSVHRIGDFTLPMGLLMAAIHVCRHYRVVIVDQVVERNWQTKLGRLLEENPVCVGISAMTGVQILEGLRASRIVKRHGCPIVWGGIHPTIQPESTLAHELVDYVVAGEGEVAFAELVDALAAGKSGAGIPGVWYTDGDRSRYGGDRERFVDLNALPAIPYHLIDMRKYIKPSSRGNTLNLYTSRGCPQQCTFCYNNSINKRRWRSFSADRTISDIHELLKVFPDIRHFQFWDDDFFTNPKRARRIAEGLTRISPAITWSALGAHVREVDRMDTDYLRSLQESGCKEMLIGVESGSEKVLKLIKKNFKLEELFRVNQKLQKFGITPTYTFISGVPGEDDTDIKKSIAVMFKLKRDNPDIILGNMKPVISYPGTALYRKALELGFKPPESLAGWGDYTWGNYMEITYPWVTPARKRLLSHLYYYTVLMNPEYMFIRSKIFTFLAKLLLPIAAWRVKNFSFVLPVESWGMNLVRKYVM
jgi:anaerobic magnesium-protoporphyrin IX monomethyl ester cyclase